MKLNQKALVIGREVKMVQVYCSRRIKIKVQNICDPVDLQSSTALPEPHNILLYSVV
jgi:hypothetical protein